MGEAEWLACADPKRMLWWITSAAPSGSAGTDMAHRKLRLFACACCRQVWHVLSDRNRRTVEVAERFLDGLTTDGELLAVSVANVWLTRLRHMDTGQHSYLPAILYEPGLDIEPAAQAALLRDIVGNPWRPVRLPREVLRLDNVELVGRCPWQTPDVLRLAKVIYDTRDFAALPILADALEDVGCDNEAILMHLRGFQLCANCFVGKSREPYLHWMSLRDPHARGCWALDLVLGKE